MLAPDFLDGRFFRVTLLTDPRFGEAAMLLGGLSQEELGANRRALSPLPEGAALGDAAADRRDAAPARDGRVSTWGILAAGGGGRRRDAGTRGGGYATRCCWCSACVTYAFAPVAGFGWVLLVMGLTQTSDDDVWLRRLYVATFLVILFYSEVPWAALLLDVMA